MAVAIQPLHTLAEMRACEALQQTIWGFNDRSIVPHHLLQTSAQHGGAVLGAYEGEALIGFVFSFPGYDARLARWKHCSLMCGVRPERQYGGVGFRLKRAQREIVLGQELDLITWTFDPLQSLNAHFNLTKLGAIVRRYERDIYGNIGDELNRGLPTDRFVAEWWLASPYVRAHLESDAGPSSAGSSDRARPSINGVAIRDDGHPVNARIDRERSEARLAVAIPRAINAIKREDPELARQWRRETRAIFERYFERGYVAHRLTTTPPEGADIDPAAVPHLSWCWLSRTSGTKLLSQRSYAVA